MSGFILRMIPILFISLSACTPLLSAPQFESINPALLDNFDGSHKAQEGLTFILTITELNLNDNTDLGLAFSELYLGDFLDNKVQSYLSVQDFMYGGNRDRLLISLNPTVISQSDSINICLISAKPESNRLNVKNKLDCKSFRVSELMRMGEIGEKFSLKNTSAKTPTLDLLIHPQT